MSRFGRNDEKQNGYEFRAEERDRLEQFGGRCVATLNGRGYALRDLSEGGFSVNGDEATAPRKAMVEIRKGGRVIRSGYAMRAWGEDRAIGYRMMQDLPVVVCAGANDETVLRARGIRRRLHHEMEREAMENGPMTRTATRMPQPEPARPVRSYVADTASDRHKTDFQHQPASVVGLRARLGFNPGRK